MEVSLPVLKGTTDAFVAVDREWRVTFLNDPAARLLQRLFGAEGAGVGRSLWDVAPGAVGTGLHTELRRAMSDGAPVEFEESLPEAEAWLEVHAFPSEEGLAIFLRDVTDLRRARETARLMAREKRARADAERERAERERVQGEKAHALALLDTMLACSPIGQAFLDPEYRYLRVNPTLAAYHGLPVEAHLGRTYRELFPQFAPVIEEQLNQAVESRTPVLFEAAGPSPVAPEEIRHWRALYYPIHDSGGDLVGIGGYVEDVTEQRRGEETVRRQTEALEQALRRQEEIAAQLDAMLTHAPVGFAFFDRDYRYVRVNDTLAQINGVPAEAHVGRTLREIVPANAAAVEPILDEVFRTGLPIRELEVAGETPLAPGVVRHWLTAFYPVADDEGRTTMVGVTVQEITQRKRAEAAQQATADRLHLAMAASRMGDWSWEAATDQVRLSDTAAEFFGLPPGGTITWQELRERYIHPDDAENARREVARSVADRGDYSAEYRVLRPDGTLRWLAAHGRPGYADDGKPERMEGVVQDITERKRAEEALRESEERFRTMADNIAQFAWMADATGWLFWYNRRWYDYTGTTLQEMEGWGWKKVHHPDHAERVAEKFRRCVETGEAWEDTFPLRSAAGEYRWFLSRAFPVRNERGDVVLWFGTNTDITEQKELMEQLAEADRRKTEFLAMLAHELRNPLSPIMNSITLLRMRPSPDPMAERHREIIHRQARHLARLVDDLLDVSRITRGRIELRRQSAVLQSIIEQAVESARPLLEEREHRLEVSLPEAPVHVDADLARMVQVVTNLLNNAARYTDPGGRVEISLEVETGEARGASEGEWAVVRVRDTGVGMSAEELAHVFEPFVQARQDLARSRGGLGVGLTLVKELVEMHGGTVSARSSGPGKGSEFAVRIPVDTQEQRPV